MGLTSTIQDGAATIFTALGDLVRTGTFNKVGIKRYNPTLKTNTEVGSAYYSISAIIVGYELDKIDGERIQPNDVMIFLKGNDITFRPKPNDIITLTSELTGRQEFIDYNARTTFVNRTSSFLNQRMEKYVLIHPETDPANAIWILQSRPA